MASTWQMATSTRQKRSNRREHTPPRNTRARHAGKFVRACIGTSLASTPAPPKPLPLLWATTTTKETATATISTIDLDEKYSKGYPLRAIFNVAEIGRFNVEEIGTGRNIRPKANMGDAVDNDKRDRDSDTCRQRRRIASPSR